MSIKLVYHNKESSEGGISPFDRAIVEIVKDEDIKIASPYISLDYLKRIISLCKSWRVITDINELFLTQNNESSKKFYEFINNNLERFHHIENLHAKAIIANNKAFFGSANFTNSGIKNLVELSALISDHSKVKELDIWYDSLWEQSSSPNIFELDKYLSFLEHRIIKILNNTNKRIKSKAKPIKSKLAPIHKNKAIGSISSIIENYNESLFIAYSFVYIENAIIASQNFPKAEAIVIQPYEKERNFTSALNALRLYKSNNNGQGIPILFSPQGRMVENGQFFEYGSRLLDIININDKDIVEESIKQGRWIYPDGDDELYAEKNILIVKNPIRPLKSKFSINISNNIENGKIGKQVGAISIPAPKVVRDSYKYLFEII